MSRPGVRRVREADVPDVVELVRELADYEGAPEFRLTSDGLREALFGPAPTVSGHVAEAGGEPVGVALWYLTFPAYLGRPGMYLDSLYVRPGQRGSGVGKALIVALAEECAAQGLTQLQWSAASWNDAAIGFYKSLGAVVIDDQTRFGLSGAALTALARPGRTP